MLWIIIAIASVTGCSTEVERCRAADEVPHFRDRDEDGFGNNDDVVYACEPPAGYVVAGGDCDDLRPETHPGAPERCDGLDNNCDGVIDEGFPHRWYLLDRDGDGFGDDNAPVRACFQSANLSRTRGDCNDFNAAINPDATEVCNGVDDNCNGRIDDADPELDTTGLTVWWPDVDLDGFGDADNPTPACVQPPGYIDNGDDCDDDNPYINPAGFEICNGVDDNCNRLSDDTDPTLLTFTRTEWFRDLDGDGYGDPNHSVFLCSQPWFHVDNNLDCDDTDPGLGPPTLWLVDADGDGFGDENGPSVGPSCQGPPGTVPLSYGLDCDDTDPTVYSGAPETCGDGIDQSCDGEDPPYMWYPDDDGDGFGRTEDLLIDCSGEPPGYVLIDGDCDDTDPLIFPGAPERCNGIDDNCDGELEPGWQDEDGDGWRVCDGDLDDNNPDLLPFRISRIGTPKQQWLFDSAMRGNQHLVTEPITLHSFGPWLQLDQPCTVDYYVHTSPGVLGPWTLVASGRQAHPAGDFDFLVSPVFDVPLQPGTYVGLAFAYTGCRARFVSQWGGVDQRPVGVGTFARGYWSQVYTGYNPQLQTGLFGWSVDDYAFGIEVRTRWPAAVLP